MRLRLSLTILLISFFQNVRAQVFTQFRQGDSIIAGAGCSRGFYKDYAFKPKDVNSYRYIADHFGKDRFQAYFGGKPLPQINPAKAVITFAKEKGGKADSYNHAESFLTDGDKIYYENRLMQNAKVNDIYYIINSKIPLFVSNNNAYFKGYLLKNVDPAKIILINNKNYEKTIFFTDGKCVFRNEIMLADADVKSFRTAGYTARELVDGKYIDKKISDSRDNNGFYLEGKKTAPYPKWREMNFFPDSIYNKDYMVTFTSQYQTQDVTIKPAIDFYLTPKDFERLTKNKILLRKKELQLAKKPTIRRIMNDDVDVNDEIEVKGYVIQIFKNKKVVSTLYYEEELEELDIKEFTRIGVVGDGFHLSKDYFNSLRQEGRPLIYLREGFESIKAAEQKTAMLEKSNKVICQDMFSYCYCDKNKRDKQYKLEIYDSQVVDNQGIITKPSSFEGVFTFKVKRKEVVKIVGIDLIGHMNEEVELKKNELVTKLFGKGVFYVGQSDGSEYINDEEWLTYELYCSKEFMKQVSDKFIHNEWHMINHIISWQEI